MKKNILFLCIVSVLAACEKSETKPTTVTSPTPVFNIVGTWALESAKVTLDGKDLIISKGEITKGGFFKADGLETTFTADGKYNRGSETGAYVLIEGQLKLGTFTYNSFKNTDLSTFVYGNIWGEGNTNAALKDEVFFVSQKILDNVQIPLPTNSKNVTYLFTYKKK